MRRSLFAFLCCSLGVAECLAASDVVISEFMASNTRTVTDENGLYPDWIELHNTTTTNISLNGWFLTDSASKLTKWRFPATNLVADGYLLVFADGKDRAIAGAPLHTSFSLSASGEYLALVRPDLTIATQFSPTFPLQQPDVSYGFGPLVTNLSLVSTATLARVQIPANGNDSITWTLPAYDDSSWIAGTNGVGYASTNVVVADYASPLLAMAPVAYWRLNDTGGTSCTNLGSLGATLNATYAGVTLGASGPRPPAFPGFEANNNAPTFNGSSSYVTANNSLLSGKTSFTMAGWFNLSAIPAARTGLFGQNDCVEFGFSAAGTMQAWTPNGAVNLTWSQATNVWYHVAVLADGANIKIYTNGLLAASSPSTAGAASTFPFNIGGNGIFDATANFFPGQLDEIVVFHRALATNELATLYQAGVVPSGVPVASFVKTDVGPVMSNINSSAYIRLPFNVDSLANFDLLTLRMRYNDGFVAYLNGFEIARGNANDPLTYNSTATTNHSAAKVDEFRVSTNGLVPGTNILAIQGLNVASNDVDFLVVAELTGAEIAATSPNPVYFTTPTPGGPNSSGVANPGPAIIAESHVPNVPQDNEDLTVTATVAPTFYPVSQVVMRYRVMFNPEIEVQMFDDGLHGDGAAGDGVFGASIPASASTNGEMIRWYFRASDTNGNVSRWPLFADPSDSAEYLGTIVEPNITSKLPVMHLFAPPAVLQPGPTTAQTGADSQAGGKVALLYDGEFYDNVTVNLRGNSTAGFNKKSHHVNFNSEHPFRHNGPGPRIKHTSFCADYPDPTYMRQRLSLWLADQMGAPAPFYIPVRLQLNSQFYQLANHSDVQGPEQLDRMGYDPNGALYKAAGTIQNSEYSTGNFEKKTRLNESHADYQTLASGVAETNSVGQRRTNAFELFDIPEVLNYLVTARWAHENDDSWANMSVYRDSDGDGRWRIIPFDMNLSWGAIFYEGGAACQSYVEGVQATNDVHKGFPMYASGAALPCGSTVYNRLYDTFFQVPELRQMWQRRMRTLLDTWVKPIGTPTNSTYVEQQIISWRNLIAEEAARDRAKWSWPPKGGQCNFDPGIDITNGVNALLSQFFITRRYHLYGKHSVTNTALAIGIGNNPVQNAGIPLAQPPNPVIQIGQFEYNPSSGNQGQEYIQLTNPNPYAVDISGWRLDRAVNFTFKPGTVILSNSVLYVTPDLKAFRTRTTTPRTNQALFVVGNYSGQLSARGETIVLKDAADNIVSTNQYIGNPSLPQQYLRITEIMYHPGPTNAGSPYPQEDFEYIEFKNIGPVPISLIGVHFTNGITFAFTATSAVTNLAAGQSVVLVKNPAAFSSRYGAGPVIAGVYTGNLDNNGEHIQLHDAVGEEILDFSYDNKWYPITDGLGFSLVIVDETAPFNTWGDKASWRASGRINGSPGAADTAPAVSAPVLVNEVLANSLLPQVDAIEIWNPTASTADIGNWYISDDFFTPKKFHIAAGTTIPPGGYIVFDEHNFNTNPASPTSFAFGSKGDDAYIFAADASGTLLGYYHGFSFGPSDEGVTFGRYISNDELEQFVAQKSPTLGAANSGPRVGPVVISEIMYHPPDIFGMDDQQDEYIELLNISSNSVAFYDTNYPTNSWKLKDAVDFVFSTNTVLNPGAYLLVVSFDPQTNTTALAAFRAKYSLDPAVTIVGPYQGKLDNSGDHVELAHPQPPETNGFGYVLTDKVDYQDVAPWNVAADGFGAALHRIVLGDFGNEPTNWAAASPTPGGPFPGGTPPVITLQISNISMISGRTTNFTIAAAGTGLSYQWRFNGSNIDGATSPTLTLTNVQTSQAGIYTVAIFNSGGAVLSSNAQLSVFNPASIIAQPLSQTGPPGTNATFNVVATGTGTLRYQWFRGGTNLAGATNASLLITNAQLYPDCAVYSVLVNDDLGSILSSNATLIVAVKPFYTNVQSSVAVQGTTASVSIGAGPVHPLIPLTYRWVTTNTIGVNGIATNATFYITNVQSSGFLRLSVTAINSLTGATIGTTNVLGIVSVTVLADSDHDGIPDVWENANGLNPNDPSDATRDDDGDGMINRDEFIAGTNPHDPLSVLKLSITATNSALLQFTAMSNISYTIQYRTNLNSAPWLNWSNVPAQNAPHPVPFVAATNDVRFYRVVTPQQP